MWKLRSLIAWLFDHVFIRSRNLNDDKDAKPVQATEIGLKFKF